jgi:hypothetical protein
MSILGNYVTGRDALMGLYLRRSVHRFEPRLNKLYQAKKITVRDTQINLELKVNCRNLYASDKTDSHAESQPLLFSPYISAAGGVFPSGNRYLSLFTASGFFIPLPGVPPYFFTPNSDKS